MIQLVFIWIAWLFLVWVLIWGGYSTWRERAEDKRLRAGRQ